MHFEKQPQPQSQARSILEYRGNFYYYIINKNTKIISTKTCFIEISYCIHVN
jgi:hypothetical protein